MWIDKKNKVIISHKMHAATHDKYSHLLNVYSHIDP